MADLLTPDDVAQMRRNAIRSQYRRDVAAWADVRFADGPLEGRRLRLPAASVGAALLVGFAALTSRGVVQAIYRAQGSMLVLEELVPVGELPACTNRARIAIFDAR